MRTHFDTFWAVLTVSSAPSEVAALVRAGESYLIASRLDATARQSIIKEAQALAHQLMAHWGRSGTASAQYQRARDLCHELDAMAGFWKD